MLSKWLSNGYWLILCFGCLRNEHFLSAFCHWWQQRCIHVEIWLLSIWSDTVFLSKRDVFDDHALCGNLRCWITSLLCVLVVIVDECLEVAHFDHLTFFSFVFDQWVDLQGLTSVLCQKLLDSDVVKQLILSQSKNLKCLLFGYKSALDPQTLFGYLLPTGVTVLLCVGLVVLLA